MADPISLFNPNDNVTGRDGGPYLDEVEARNAEARRAVVEDREPDFDNPPATAGIPLLPAGRMLGIVGVNNLPSQGHRLDLSDTGLIQSRADSDDEPNFNARGEIPAEFVEAVQEAEREAAEDVDTSAEDEDDVVVEEDNGVEPNSHDPNSGEPDLTASDEEETGESASAEDLGFDLHAPVNDAGFTTEGK